MGRIHSNKMAKLDYAPASILEQQKAVRGREGRQGGSAAGEHPGGSWDPYSIISRFFFCLLQVRICWRFDDCNRILLHVLRSTCIFIMIQDVYGLMITYCALFVMITFIVWL